MASFCRDGHIRIYIGGLQGHDASYDVFNPHLGSTPDFNKQLNYIYSCTIPDKIQ